MASYFTLNTIPELLCFITAMLCLRSDRDIAWRLLPVYLGIVCITELSGIYICRNISDNNTWIYNVLLVFECAMLSFVFHTFFKRTSSSGPMIIMGLALLFVVYLVERARNGLDGNSFFTSCLLALLTILYCFYYLYLLTKHEQAVDLSVSPEFWWIAGTLLFYFATTTINMFWLVLQKVSRVGLLAYVHKTINIILYSCWAYAFICRRWQKQTSPPSLLHPR